MGLKLQSMDYAALFRDEVLDGPDDKKIDFFFIDREAGTALIAQDFQSPNWDKAAPPTNKATDLNAAISWIFDAELDDIPTPALRAKALELRDAITEGIFTALK